MADAFAVASCATTETDVSARAAATRHRTTDETGRFILSLQRRAGVLPFGRGAGYPTPVVRWVNGRGPWRCDLVSRLAIEDGTSSTLGDPSAEIGRGRLPSRSCSRGGGWAHPTRYRLRQSRHVVDAPLSTGTGVRDRRRLPTVGLQVASSTRWGNRAKSGRPAPPPRRDGACVRPGASSPIPHSQPLRGIVGSGCCHLMDANWSSGRRGWAGSGWSGFTIGKLQILGIRGWMRTDEEKNAVRGVVCSLGSSSCSGCVRLFGS